MSQSDIPMRSQSGMAALDIFYADFNDVNFYVEDQDQENLYYEIFRKLFKNVRITRIFPLGGKSAIFQHATSEANRGIKCFRSYIVDRDFDHLLGKQFEHPNVFYLDRFCIENHLLEPAAIVEMVIENHPKRKRTDVKIKLSPDSKIRNLYRSLRPLFELFFCAQFLNLTVKNCSSPPEVFCEPRRLWKLNDAAISKYRETLEETAEANGLDSHMFDSQFDLAIACASTASNYELVSGKFAAAMLFHYIKSEYSLGSMTFESFVYRLAKSCTLRSMQAFASRVRAGLRSHLECSSSLSAPKEHA